MWKFLKYLVVSFEYFERLDCRSEALFHASFPESTSIPKLTAIVTQQTLEFSKINVLSRDAA